MQPVKVIYKQNMVNGIVVGARMAVDGPRGAVVRARPILRENERGDITLGGVLLQQICVFLLFGREPSGLSFLLVHFRTYIRGHLTTDGPWNAGGAQSQVVRGSGDRRRLAVYSLEDARRAG
jgi:hypothetical protein